MPDLAHVAHQAQSKTTKAAKKARSNATKGASKAQAKATKTATKGRAKAARTTARAVGRPVSRRDKALQTTNRVASTTARAGAVAAQTGARVAVVGTILWWRTVDHALRQEPSRRRAKVARAPLVAAAALTGAGIEYLIDPTDGKRRRNDALARGTAIARRVARRGSQQARYAAGVAKGAAHEATSQPTAPVDDRTLADRVRTEVLRPDGAPKGSVNIGVVDGVVYLRGELSSPDEIARLIAHTRQVSGVRDVESMLHVPGVGAPNGGAG